MWDVEELTFLIIVIFIEKESVMVNSHTQWIIEEHLRVETRLNMSTNIYRIIVFMHCSKIVKELVLYNRFVSMNNLHPLVLTITHTNHSWMIFEEVYVQLTTVFLFCWWKVNIVKFSSKVRKAEIL